MKFVGFLTSILAEMRVSEWIGGVWVAGFFGVFGVSPSSMFLGFALSNLFYHLAYDTRLTTLPQRRYYLYAMVDWFVYPFFLIWLGYQAAEKQLIWRLIVGLVLWLLVGGIRAGVLIGANRWKKTRAAQGQRK